MKNPLIIALDVETAAHARALVDALGDSVSFYKVGLELYASAGMDFVREMKARGHRVFLDLKLYDIGETVKRATVQIARADVDFLSVHARVQVMESALAGRRNTNLKILAVTVLTSLAASRSWWNCAPPTPSNWARMDWSAPRSTWRGSVKLRRAPRWLSLECARPARAIMIRSARRRPPKRWLKALITW
jgi:hypothetical protein